jgi:hypothetical protein
MLNRGNKLKEDSMEGIWDEKPEKLLGVGTVSPPPNRAICLVRVVIIISFIRFDPFFDFHFTME